MAKEEKPYDWERTWEVKFYVQGNNDDVSGTQIVMFCRGKREECIAQATLHARELLGTNFHAGVAGSVHVMETTK